MGPTRPGRRRWLVWFLALCVVWTLGVIAWAAVALLTPAGDGPEEAVERKAGMHHDQHQPAGRYYIPTYAKVEKDGTAVLRYEVGNSQDSSVEDFLRTYDITAEPKRTSPSKVTYSDRFGDVRRTFTITYNPSPEPGGYDYARITVRARGTDAS
ncbi:hypothetical protein QQM39_42885 [Streptomyces sp. DT2A-34]|uniref:hypothetical protein n=1 Tax=Streptomyces sp. DT2A-34 TaxID=3051182 RepID=UPI00265BDC9E|nr:hypothetical protein [Streptomyces sp. DT2A-34]MDO0917311.1 hypothetical protein [Streptomyces sp. DT2A-34]